MWGLGGRNPLCDYGRRPVLYDVNAIDGGSDDRPDPCPSKAPQIPPALLLYCKSVVPPFWAENEAAASDR